MVLQAVHDSRGYLTRIDMLRNGNVIHRMTYNFEGSTGNLLSRSGMCSLPEAFAYDDLDRLTGVTMGGVTRSVSYHANGNISNKTDLGSFYYGSSHPHAVTGVGSQGNIPTSAQTAGYTPFGKVATLSENGYTMTFTYGPGEQRWKTILQHNGATVRTTLYAGDYERITENGTTRHIYYLDHGVIYVLEDGDTEGEFYYTYTDHLGSITRIYNETGTTVFSAEYDAWGRQTLHQTNGGFTFHRGYTGHEMLPEFGLINMNGRLYDPILGRFLSPDNYVQMPDFSQSFNRYSYCLNNPLKYTDPSGELFGIDDAIIAFAAFSMASSMVQAAFNGESVWKAAGLSLLSSAASYGIGSAFGPVGNWGNELLRAGAHGIASGAIGALNGGGFGSGFVTGALSSGIGSFAQGVNMNPALMVASTSAMGGFGAWLTGGNVMQGVMQGMSIGLFNHAKHEGEVIKHKDGTLEVVDPLPEVIVGAKHNISFRLISEKPLEPIFPEFALLSMLRGGYNLFRYFLHSKYEKSFFEGATYHNRTLNIKEDNLYHKFPRSVDAFENAGRRSIIRGGDGYFYEKLEIPGKYGNHTGIFEYIKDSKGIIRHRFFKPL